MVTTMATTTAALLLAAIGIVTFDAALFRRSLIFDLSALSTIIADNSTAAIVFDDPRAATETLGALRARPHMVTACIYRADGSILANYGRQATNSVCPAAGAQDGVQFSMGSLSLSHAILLRGRRVGTLVMRYELDELTGRVKIYGATVLGVLMVSSLVAFLLTSRLRAVIETPISQLVRATTSVSETSDYRVRAQKLSGDELGVLVDRFNEMLGGIQSRDNELRKALREREEAWRDAEKARERFRFMAESMPQKIFTATPGGEVDYYNRQWMEFTGLPFERIKDSGWTQFIHPEDVEDNVRAWRHSVETGEPFHFQHRVRRADGAYRWHLSRAQAMRDAAGNISMWIAIEHGHPRAKGDGGRTAPGQRRPSAVRVFREPRSSGADPECGGIQRDCGEAI